MVNRYTSDRRVRSDDAYTPGGAGGKRPDRCVIVYSQRVREAYKSVPIVIGGIEASLRRIAHFDYWSEQVRRSVLVDAKADLLVFGNAERQIVEHRAAPRRAASRSPASRTCAARRSCAARMPDGLDRDRFDANSTRPGPLASAARSLCRRGAAPAAAGGCSRPPRAAPDARQVVKFYRQVPNAQRERSVIRLPSFEQVSRDPVLYAHASRILHLESNPGNARALVQRHGDRRCVAQSAADSARHRPTWTPSTNCRTRGGRTRATARRGFPPTT